MAPPSKFREILGDTVVNCQDGSVVPVDSLTTRANQIGLYFAADGEIRSQRSTQILVNYYNTLTECGQFDLEIVLISTQSCEERFKKLVSSMPWWHVDFKELYARQVIPKKFGISEMPRLILVDSKTGQVVDEDGMATVERNLERRLNRNVSFKEDGSSGLSRGNSIRAGHAN